MRSKGRAKEVFIEIPAPKTNRSLEALDSVRLTHLVVATLQAF